MLWILAVTLLFTPFVIASNPCKSSSPCNPSISGIPSIPCKIEKSDEGLVAGRPIGIPSCAVEQSDPIPKTIYRNSNKAGSTKRHCPSIRCRGGNLEASSLELENDYDNERGYLLKGVVTNNGTDDLFDVVIRFIAEIPGTGSVKVGEDIVIPSLLSGEQAFPSVTWSNHRDAIGFSLLADPDDLIVEDDENDNSVALNVSCIRNVPWVWQEVDGFCNYAGLAMLFNHLGADHTASEAVEFGHCAHSVVYLKDELALYGGTSISQAESDYHHAGTIRNLACDIDVHFTWNLYLNGLKASIDSGLPFVTSVDPYYLPQEDYDPLRQNGIHSGHAVVVTGYTDSSVIINDPGVGLAFLSHPAIPDPENRGADVVIDLVTFRLAVKKTLGTSFLSIAYSPAGPMPKESIIRSEAMKKSVQRLEGDTHSYDPAWCAWPSHLDPVYGLIAYLDLSRDMNQTTFTEIFNEILQAAGGNLALTVNTMAQQFCGGMYGAGIGWHASARYFQTLDLPFAGDLADISKDLSVLGQKISSDYSNMLVAIYDAQGDLSVAGPYLDQLSLDLEQVTALQMKAYDLLVLVYGASCMSYSMVF